MTAKDILPKLEHFKNGNYYVRVKTLSTEYDEIIGMIEDYNDQWLTLKKCNQTKNFNDGRSKFLDKITYHDIESIEEFPVSEWN
jgi:hypothetical protein